jgi:high affinity Mn2+ porin
MTFDLDGIHRAMRRTAPCGLGALLALGLAAAPALADDDAQPTADGGSKPAAAAADDTPQSFAFHGQFTSVSQYHPSFRSAFQGPQSLDPGSRGDTTNDVTLYLGFRPWKGAEVWLDPEIDQGFGLSNTLGVAGFTSGEAYKVGRTTPYFRLQRWFLRQTIDLGGDSKKVDADLNQLGGSQTENRLVFTVGKFSVVDIFDTNKYAHDARNDFLNWSIIDTGTYDYAADAWGYTYGAAAEWYQGDWTTRLGLFDLSKIPNNKKLDPTFEQFQYDAELEHRHKLWGQDGAVRVTAFLSRGRMGDLNEAVALADATGQPADIAAVRHYASRVGVSATLEQQIHDDLGGFVRAGWAQGNTEAYEFTDIDTTVSAGLSLTGKRWGRDKDTVGLAGVVNEASGDRLAFLNAGGLGILAGDGMLPNSGPEQILETYYSLALFKVAHLTLDYQFIANPAYNRDRGPVSVFGARVHAQF